MLVFKQGIIPDLAFEKAVKKPIPIRCVQVHEPFVVETIEGPLTAKAGDWLVVGVRGEMYAVDNSIFQETYDVLKA